MASRPNRHTPTHPRRRKRRGCRRTFRTFWRFLRARWKTTRRVMKAVLASPPTVRAVVLSALILLLWLGVNWAYHAFNKPREILFPLGTLTQQSPVETWKEYGSLFREHATAVITAEFLAALAQMEVRGIRWRGPIGGGISCGILEWYQPASSAVGMYQNHRRDLPRGDALLHPRSRGGRGRPVARPAIVLVQ